MNDAVFAQVKMFYKEKNLEHSDMTLNTLQMIADLLLANEVNRFLECNSCFMVALNPKECPGCQ
jgi:hypothetical protein